MVVSGTSRAGVGAALNFLAGVKSGKAQLDRTAVVRSGGNFEGGMLVKEIGGDTNLDGIAGGEDEFVTLHQIIFDEPFQYYWRVVKGENITVSGGFIRMVNDTKVYIRALGFNVSVRVKNNKGITLTYVIDNINPNYVMAVSDQEDAMKEAIFGGTKVVVVSSGDFSIIPANVSNYTVLAFGDHRPGSGEKQPEVFFKIRDAINKENGAFVIDSGDLVYSGTIYQWEELMKPGSGTSRYSWPLGTTSTMGGRASTSTITTSARLTTPSASGGLPLHLRKRRYERLQAHR
ncbi:hypothetical protein [Thermococcus sp. JCM 11816]|uniref:hypothetical protein n=1 Tax=Thermococcus sp. (strain JCM 11816 / KS-1) TaxID=1295125 RepID=UPI000A98A4AD